MKHPLHFKLCDALHLGWAFFVFTMALAANVSASQCLSSLLIPAIIAYLAGVLMALAIRADDTHHKFDKPLADTISRLLPNRLPSLIVMPLLVGAVVLAFAPYYPPIASEDWASSAYQSFLTTMTIEVAPTAPHVTVVWQLITSALLLLAIIPIVVSSVYSPSPNSAAEEQAKDRKQAEAIANKVSEEIREQFKRLSESTKPPGPAA